MKNTSTQIYLIFLGAFGLWLGMANPVWQFPLAIMLYPGCLYLLGMYSKQAFRHGWLCGLLGSSACLYWIAIPVHDYGLQNWLVSALCACLLGTYMGLYGGIFAWATHKLRHVPFSSRLLMLAFTWYLLEWIRNCFATGFAWLPLAAAFVPWINFIQLCSVIGAYGLGAVLTALACLGADGLSYFAYGGMKKFMLSLAGLSLIFTFGTWRLDLLSELGAEQEKLPIALVQGNINQNQKWTKDYQKYTFELYSKLSKDFLKSNQAQLLIFPETAMPFMYQKHELSPLLRNFVREQEIWLLFGAPARQGNQKDSILFNRAYMISPLGQDQGFYAKEHLVPFGEYLPSWLNIDFIQAFTIIGNFYPGSNQNSLLMTTHSGRKLALGVLICYESIFPELAQARVEQGASLLINISNDAWFGKSAAPWQHLQLSVLRAVEQKRYLARGTNTGISAIISPLGKIEKQGNLFVPEVISGEVTPIVDRTVFNKIYKYITLFCFFALLVLLWLNRKFTNFKLNKTGL